MKIRLGFVSNSSSSSFCILGCRLTKKIKEFILNHPALNVQKIEEKKWECPECKFSAKHNPRFCEKCGSLMGEQIYFVNEKVYIDEACEDLGLTYCSGTEWGELVGVDSSNKSIEELIKLNELLVKILGEGIEFKNISGEREC